MQFLAIFRVLGVLLMLFSFSMLPPLFVSQYYHDGGTSAFALTLSFTLLTGFLLWLPTRHSHKEIKIRDGFLIVVLFWSVLSLFAALPFLLIQNTTISFTDSIFESVSALTTTGTNVLKNLDTLPHAIRYYRQQTEFLGGMGIIVLAVAIMPMLGVGGMQLYRAETPGPIKDNKLTPRITETAKTLWYIYIGLTISCAIAYRLGGMTLFEAVGESFGTISTGGFSVYNASLGHYHSATINLIAIVFMLLGSINFALHYVALHQRNLNHYWRDSELRAFLYTLSIATLLVTGTLLFYNVYPSFWQALLQAAFSVVSLGSTTGFIADNFSTWPVFVPYLIMLLALIGGCAGSTSGGLKVVRLVLLQRQSARELRRLIHPKATLNVKLNKRIVPEEVVQAIWAFVAVFIAALVIMLLLLLATGLDFTTAFGSVVACLSNAGASIGQTALNFNSLSPFGKWVLIVAMLAGRLEIFTLLVLFTPEFWRR